jgi:hypothetical protein
MKTLKAFAAAAFNTAISAVSLKSCPSSIVDAKNG